MLQLVSRLWAGFFDAQVNFSRLRTMTRDVHEAGLPTEGRALLGFWPLAFCGAVNPGCRRASARSPESRRISRALQHDAFETRSRRNACAVCEWPVPCRRRPGKAACRHDCLPHRAADCTLGNSQSRGASLARLDKLKACPTKTKIAKAGICRPTKSQKL
jgi:hypothetical protein